MSAPGRQPVTEVQMLRLRLPLADPWVSPVATIVERDLLLVGATVAGIVGWGECVAQPDPTYSAEYVDGAMEVIRRHLAPRALASATTDVDHVLGPVKGHPMAKAALATAVLDAELRATGTRLVDHLATISRHAGGAHAAAVPAGVAVGVSDGIDALVDEVGRRVEQGYQRVKIKVHPGWDVVPVEALRGAFGPDLALQVDANGSYAALGPVEAASRLQALDDHRLLAVEQPLGDDDLVGHAALARALRPPICLDESITSVDGLTSALALGSCGVVNVKPGRVGGLNAAVAIADSCAASGVAVWCGGMLETGVGRATNLALAALPSFSLPGDLSASDRYWPDDVVTEPARLRPDGTIEVPAGPGTGVELRTDLDRWVVERWCSR